MTLLMRRCTRTGRSSFVSLPRRLRRLANEAVVTLDRPYPPAELAPSLPGPRQVRPRRPCPNGFWCRVEGVRRPAISTRHWRPGGWASLAGVAWGRTEAGRPHRSSIYLKYPVCTAGFGAFYGESRFGADQLVANEHEPAVRVVDYDEVLAAQGQSSATVNFTCQHAERVALLEALDGHEFMLDSA